MSAFRLPGRILALTPGDLGPGQVDVLLARARAAIDAGLDSILVREPLLGDRATLEVARALRGILGRGGWLGIHDRIHLADAAGADAVHMGFRSLAPQVARAVCPGSIAIGFSAHAHDDASVWSGADYLVFGPVFATPSKAGLLQPVGPAGLARFVEESTPPVWALGGVTPETLGALAPAMSMGFASRRLLLADDAAATMRAWQAGLSRLAAAQLPSGS